MACDHFCAAMKNLPIASALFLALLPLASASAEDSRLGEPLTLHGYHPFRSVENAEAWESRRADIRDRVLLASGLLPLPEKTPLRAKRFDRRERDGFAVEKVYFESFPGHYVTANLYTPAGKSLELGLNQEGKRPGVLSPHGHWKEGRFYDLLEQRGERAVREQIASGAERFVSSARNPIQARCVQLARMGCIVLQYDMLGYADSDQFPEHRRGPREAMNSPESGKWGFVSPQATLRLQSNFGLQTWNSIRALDFVAGLEEVDLDRILVTGASGGATQTMMLAAVDDRVAAAFPSVMPSTAMQGGCTCENACYLRIGQGNMDIAAAGAPKPLGIAAADDWTVELETKGHPDLVKLYQQLGSEKNYEAHFDIHFKHNFNHVTRSHLYDFVNRHFGIGLEAPVLERDHEFLDRGFLSVWSEGKPDGWGGGDAHEREVNRRWAELSDKTMTDEAMRRAWSLILRRSYDGVGEATFELLEKEEAGGKTVLSGIISRGDERVAARFHHPAEWNGKVLVWLSRKGIAGMEKSGEVARAVDSGAAVVGLDLFQQGGGDGERTSSGNPGTTRNPATTYSDKGNLPADSWQRSPVYYYGYNDSVFARRVHDILSTVKMIRSHPDWEVEEIRLGGEEGTGHWAAAAAFLADKALDITEAKAGDFRFANLDDSWHEDMVPGAVKYGDVEGLLKLAGE